MNKDIRQFLIQCAPFHTLSELLMTALDTIEELTGSRISFIHFVAADQKTLSLQQWSSNTLNEFCRADSKENHYPIDQAGVWVDCVHQKKPVIHNNYASLSHKKGLPEGHTPVERELVVPVIRKDKVVAIIGVGNKVSEYTPADVEIVDNFADMIWEIIQKKRAEEELTFQRNIESALSGLASLLLTTTDIEEISTHVLSSARRLTNCDYGFVGTFDVQNNQFISHTMTQDIWEECRIEDKSVIFEKCSGLWGWVLENKKPILLNDIESDPRSKGTPPGHIKIKAFLGVPAMIKDQVVGLIALANPETCFMDIDLTLVKRLATLFAMAIQRRQHEKSLLEYQTRKAEDFENLVEQRTAELENSNILLEKIFNSQQDAIFILNAPSMPLIVNCNHSALSMFGYSREELLRQPVEYLAAPAGINPFRIFLAAYHQKSQQSPIKEFQMQTRYGRIFFAEATVSPLLQEQGRTFGTVLVIRDITQAKEAIEAVKKSEERLKLTLDSVSDAFWDWQVDTGEVYFSTRYYTMLGYVPYELPQKFDTWTSLLHPDDRAMAEKTVTRHINSPEPFEMEFRMKAKDNTYRWILARGKTVEKDAAGNALRMVGTHVDLTERKNMEIRLQHSQKMEAMGVLAGGIAHDFNNILAAIVGYAELAIEEIPEDTKPFKRINGILSASERARKLISQILTFSRKQEKNFQPMDIRMVLKEALGFMRASLPSTIQIRDQIPSVLPNIMGDPDQIHQMILNLMTNASHAMDQQTGIIYIEADPVEIGHKSALPVSMDLRPGTFIKLTVSDTGCGIAPDILPKIFDPFFTTKEKGVGTGLGLSTVHGIVKEHGGDIYVESSPGCGTRFEVFLPATIQDSIVRDDKSQSPPGGTEKILIVDDEEVLPVILQDMLETLGYAVTTLTDSREALRQFKAHPDRFDILLSDITMPHITGLQLTQAFQQIRPDMPIILWSGNNSYITEQKAIETGASQLMRKPFKRMDLAVAIRNALDKPYRNNR